VELSFARRSGVFEEEWSFARRSGVLSAVWFKPGRWGRALPGHPGRADSLRSDVV
jgi:hypothetical protein